MAKQVLEQKQNKAPSRMANMELLRSVAMMMVIVLHYLGKGNLLPQLTEAIGAAGYVAWALEALAIVAVNVYMLISGYFLVESRFKVSRVLGLIFQAMFYSLLVPVVLVLAGVLAPSGITVYQLLYYVFPTQMEHYWFLTAYVVMYLFAPILGRAVHQMTRKQHACVAGCLLVLFSLGKSVLPMSLEMDRHGYDGLWFMTVYLVAAYIRLYGIPLFSNKGRSILFYFAGCACVFGITMVLHFVYLKTGAFDYVLKVAYDYNHIVNLFAAVALFYAFLFLKLPEGKVSKLICRVAPYTFGVYLLHEQVAVRYLWPKWLFAEKVEGPVSLVLYTVVAVLTVFAVGILADMLRAFLFRLLGKVLEALKILEFVRRLDAVFAEDSREDGQIGGMAEKK